MSTAIISDIHANIEALEAVLADIASRGISDIMCLGDIVGYGPSPNECIDLIHRNCKTVLMGNHDAAALDSLFTQNFNINAKIAIEWTSRVLTQESKSFLANLPMSHVVNNATFVHATPYEPRMWYYITSIEEAAFNFQFFSSQYCFVGHTHIPVIISMSSEHMIEVSQETTVSLLQPEGRRFLINVGSVGQPRDRNPLSSYGIVDYEAGTFELRRVAYDIEKCQRKMQAANFPEFLVARLSEGR